MLTPGTVSAVFGATIATFNVYSGTQLSQLFNALMRTPLI